MATEGSDMQEADSASAADDTDQLAVSSTEEATLTLTKDDEEQVLHLQEGGSDSGVELNGGGRTIGGFELNGGGRTAGDDTGTPALSCDSSLVSCCYSSEDLVSTTVHLTDELRDLSLNAGGDGTSEGGSESSSIISTHCYNHKPRAAVCSRRKATSKPQSVSSSSSSLRPSSLSSTRSKSQMARDRSQSGRHTNSVPPSTSANPSKTANSSTSSSSKSLHPSSGHKINGQSTSIRARSSSSDPSSRVKPSMKQVTNKLRLMNGGADDGRWPSSFSKSHQVNLPKSSRQSLVSSISIQDTKKISSPQSLMSTSFCQMLLDSPTSSNTLEKYATLPRRRRKSAENLSLPPTINSREPSLNRTASLRRKHLAAMNSGGSSTPSPPVKTMPPYPRNKSRTKIYHETSVQTSLTSADLEDVLAGSPPVDVHTRVEVQHREIQVDRRIEAVERLEAQLKDMQQEIVKLQLDKKEFEETKEKLSKEKSANVAMSKRLARLLNKKEYSGDLVTELEKQILLSREMASRQKEEIIKLNSLCHTLNKNLDKSFVVQRALMQQQQESEVEAFEMQDFLQAEKSTLADSLKDTEAELNQQKELLKLKDAELARMQEECSHLVRISEQRRQEVLSMVARLKSMERRSKDVLLQQGAAVSSAAVALSGLGARLDTLVDALVTSYAISQQDLEDVVYHNEAYSDSGSSAETSPQHQHQPSATNSLEAASSRFMAAVINAIRSATSSSRRSHTETVSDSEPMLSAEPEPSGFAEGGDRDATTCTTSSSPDKRLSIASIEDGEGDGDGEGEGGSLQQLTDAIISRQEAEELSEVVGAAEIGGATAGVHSLVDQVIDVDNLVTKLLKVLTIVQATSARTNKLQTIQLSEKLNQKEEEKQCAEDIVESLRKEVHQLKSQLNDGEITDNQAFDLRKRLTEKETQLEEMGRNLYLTKKLLNDTWHQAMTEIKRQYHAIDAALEMLQSVGGLVEQNQTLSKIQQNLEETNFRCASNMPVFGSATATADHNANAAPLLNLPAISPPSPTINGTA
ncbi:serine-rich adhesin for platelets isoform X2 [Nilaparvata lugens]|uniref:serine-rich adhesin for platelets isoform X2 n=1 Tax=Nilaparvata lugens TaxID=108931 RepID=UPI00193CF886|nr:serine-rich adhesin for platelets isoform X2 [Nilaparvata lugens]